MARTQSITDEQILEAAREAFFEHGLNVTTAEIAARAGISEGTVFRRFPTKHELFMASMGLPPYPGWLDTIDTFIDGSAGGSLEQNLTVVGHEALEFFEEMIPKMSMVLASGNPQMSSFDGTQEPPAVRCIKGLANYLCHEQRAGRIRACDPEVAARTYLGALHMYAFAHTCGINEFLPMPKHTFVRGVVDQLLRGVRVEPSED
ncbi:MAG: TetR/AcrR family transcriptional regulator [Persicimonas sp.]